MLDTDLAEVVCIEQQNKSPWSPKALADELRQERGVVLVAELDNTPANRPCVVGWCASRYLAPEAELLKIAVSVELRKHGVASSLLSCLCNLLSEKGVETLFLEVRSQNQSALSFYKKTGFLQTGERIGYYSDPVDVALLFQKIL
ncbi:hypothetical protein LA52FAK_46150 [Desulforhopalus sp. 52FAK]